jgi:hypothetical protein
MTIEKIISADDHLQETPDLWERRLPVHLREKAPKIIRLENGAAAWAWGTNPPRPLGMDVWAGREIRDDRDIETVPWEKVYRGTYDPDERLNAMNRDGIRASVLYPNFSRAFVGMWLTDAAPGGAQKLDSELALACIQAYNDHIAEFCTTDPKRLIPVGIVPMESVETAVAEIRRMASKGRPQWSNTTRTWTRPLLERSSIRADLANNGRPEHGCQPAPWSANGHQVAGQSTNRRGRSTRLGGDDEHVGKDADGSSGHDHIVVGNFRSLSQSEAGRGRDRRWMAGLCKATGRMGV